MIDTSDLNKKLGNIVKYSNGFFTALEAEKIVFMTSLGAAILPLLNNYIDSKARVSPQRLHHVYEPGMVGEEQGRLFEFDMSVTTNEISIIGKFLPSSVTPPQGAEPFVHKARIMEAGMTVHISPKNGEALAFMDDGELVITSSTVTVEHPGGPEVERAFADTVYSFFSSFLTKAIVLPEIARLADMREYGLNFRDGARMGFAAGMSAGRKQVSGESI